MNLVWYIARAAGVVSWIMLAASVGLGLVLSTRFLQDRHRPAWLTDLHRFLGGSAVVFTGIHVVALLADDYIDFDLVDVLVPFAAEWRPGAVAWGIVAFWILVAVEATSLAMRRLSRRTWKAVHGLSLVLFWVASFHAAGAGTDVGAPWYGAVAVVLTLATAFLTTYRVLVGVRRGRATRERTPAETGEPSPAR